MITSSNTPAVATVPDPVDTQFGVQTELLAQPVFLERDLEWEGELLCQLSEQEQRFRDFTRSRFASDPHGSVFLAVRMVQGLDGYSAALAERAAPVRTQLPETRKISGQYILKAESLPKPAPPRTLLGVIVAPPRIPAEHRRAYAEHVRELPKIIEAYVLLLGNGFSTGPIAAKWVETCSVFIRQLTKLVNHITE